MIIPECWESCPIRKFTKILSDFIPSTKDTICDKRSLYRQLKSKKNKLPYAITYSILDDIEKDQQIEDFIQ